MFAKGFSQTFWQTENKHGVKFRVILCDIEQIPEKSSSAIRWFYWGWWSVWDAEKRYESGGRSELQSVLFDIFSQVLVTTDLPGKLVLSSEAFLREFYIEKGLSAAQIAHEIVSSKTAVLNALRRFDIPIREPHLSHGRKSQLKFGEKKIKGQITDHLKEQSIIDIIRELHEKGLTLRHVCKILTKMKIPTKNKGKKWHPEMVRRILEK